MILARVLIRVHCTGALHVDFSIERRGAETIGRQPIFEAVA
jgi:hypothetical protein